jgi:diacylglycerol kinase (ATP)
MPSPFGELTVIVNPHAGKQRVGEGLPDLERTLQARGLPYRLMVTEGPGDAKRFAREALQAGARFLVAVGGDGTVHEVVNGMFVDGEPLGKGAVLGVVAAGSGCDLVRTFGLPGDVTHSCMHLLGDSTYPLDLGKITYTGKDGERLVSYFHNVAEAGLGAAVTARAGRLPKGLGEAKYFAAFWLTLPGFKLAQVRLEADRRTYEGPAVMVIVGNCQYYGGGMRISPRSFPGDGVFDVLVFKGPKSDSFRLLPRVYRGEHIPHHHIEELRVKRALVVDADRPLPIEADGEVLGFTPATFEVVPQAISLKL